MADGMNLNSSLVDEALGGRMPGGADGPGKPRLFMRAADPDVTVAALRDVLAATGYLFDRGMVVLVAHDRITGGRVAHPLSPESILRLAHQSCRPFTKRTGKEGVVQEVDAPLPKAIATMFLDMRGEWGLPPLNGFASAPLLDDAGGVQAHDGYHAGTGLWCEGVPPGLDGAVPSSPTHAEAAGALLVLRRLLRTFAFADAAMVPEAGQDVPVVDLTRPPGMDESTALVALMTAVCRPSLPLAPGVLVRAAPLSGAGSGKGLLVRVLCAVAFGRAPAAVTAGSSPAEFDKRIGAELMAGAPVLFLDNLNDRAVQSDTLASAITERPARVRLLGQSVMVPLNSSAFIALTGNGLTVREDLARRFVAIELDAGVEDPEARRFRGDVVAEALANRGALLVATLTVWRWGRDQDATGTLASGLALGNFGQWCRWVRDPLLALGCADPARRVAIAKAGDRKREGVVELLAIWHTTYESRPMTVAGLSEELVRLLDPQGRGRQYLAASLGKLTGTRAGGFMLTAQRPAGQWGATTYSVRPTAILVPKTVGAGSGDPYAPYASAVAVADERGGSATDCNAGAMPSTAHAPYDHDGFAIAVEDEHQTAPGWSGEA